MQMNKDTKKAQAQIKKLHRDMDQRNAIRILQKTVKLLNQSNGFYSQPCSLFIAPMLASVMEGEQVFSDYVINRYQASKIMSEKAKKRIIIPSGE